jgi:hypothetical protein
VDAYTNKSSDYDYSSSTEEYFDAVTSFEVPEATPVSEESTPAETTPAEMTPAESTPAEAAPTESSEVVTSEGSDSTITQAIPLPTTLVTSYGSPYASVAPAVPEAAVYPDSSSPAKDYTGKTFDTVCPATCNPFNPAENFCDSTTSCTTTGGSNYHCACRAGFRADGYNAKDFSKQFKVPGQPYVYLAVNVKCDTPCSDNTCSEVMERPQCA